MADESNSSQTTPAKKAKSFPIRLKVDYWAGEDERRQAGDVIRLSLEPARDLIASGKAERADALGDGE